MAKYAFRCNACNTLEEGSHAGERDIPLRCRTCGKGAHYIITDAGAPQLVPEPENWTVLADLDENGIADILEYHGLDAADIEAHVPFVTTVMVDPATGEQSVTTAPREGPEVPPSNPQFIEVAATDVGKVEDVVGVGVNDGGASA